MFGLSPWELMIVFLLIILLFGAKRLPELARSLGKSIKEFKNATQGLADEFNIDNPPQQPSQAVPPKSETGEQSSSQQSSTTESK
ncbi:MAG: twin-arginine translocase TatA/TatE family subunit [Calditrichaeota bacterium]|nr:MAG: twin-arginine translocase TatA/TatE family subunit [Calditrichota bacterium]